MDEQEEKNVGVGPFRISGAFLAEEAGMDDFGGLTIKGGVLCDVWVHDPPHRTETAVLLVVIFIRPDDHVPAGNHKLTIWCHGTDTGREVPVDSAKVGDIASFYGVYELPEAVFEFLGRTVLLVSLDGAPPAIIPVSVRAHAVQT